MPLAGGPGTASYPGCASPARDATRRDSGLYAHWASADPVWVASPLAMCAPSAECSATHQACWQDAPAIVAHDAVALPRRRGAGTLQIAARCLEPVPCPC